MNDEHRKELRELVEIQLAFAKEGREGGFLSDEEYKYNMMNIKQNVKALFKMFGEEVN